MERVRELTADLYPEEQQPEDEPGNQQNENVRAKRYAQTYLFARTVKCPSCEGTIPLSPNWRLDSKGTGIRVLPDTTSGTCSFEIVTRASDQSPWNRFPGQGHLSIRQLRGDYPYRIHLPGGTGRQTGTPTLLHHLPRHLENKNQVRAGLQAPQDGPRLPDRDTG